MKVDIAPVKGLRGSISVPGDKSISHRGIIFGAISEGKTRLSNFLMSQDCVNTINIFRHMGIPIDVHANNGIIIEGRGLNGLMKPKGILDSGNSGTTARLLMGLLSAQDFESTLTGDDSLRTRPMDRVISPLRQMGARIAPLGEENHLPLTIMGGQGRLKPIDYTLPVASAQVKSAIILASLYGHDSSYIRQPAISRDHTERILKTFGGNIDIEENTITTYPPSKLYGRDLIVPGDISSAAYFMTAALLTPKSEIFMENVGINPTRSGILEVYNNMGGNIHVERISSNNLEPAANIVARSSELRATTIEGSIIPRLIDELPIIALAATQARGTTIIGDAQELKVKESNRIDATVNILKAFGAEIEATHDGMIIKGPTPLKGTYISPHSDHRIVMMAAIAGLIAEGKTILDDSQWVNISYPNFFKEIERLRR